MPVPIHVTTPLVNTPTIHTTYPGATYAYNPSPALVTPNVALTGTGTSVTSVSSSPATETGIGKSTYTSTSVTSVSPSTSSTGYTYTSKPVDHDYHDDDDNRTTALAVQRPPPVLPPAPITPIYPGLGFGFRKHFSFSKGFGLYGKK